MMAGRSLQVAYPTPRRPATPGLPERLVPLLCPGGTLVCAASGPSLTVEDLARVRGRATVIAINDAIRLAPWADVFFSNAKIFWNTNQERGQLLQKLGFAGLRIRIEIDQDKPGVQPDGAIALRNTGVEGLELQPNGIRTLQNSGGSAINVAVHLGAKRIVLLGYDMGPDARGHHHCHDVAPSRHPSPYGLFVTMMKTLVQPLSLLGVEVINCSRATKLACFPRQPLEEVFPDGCAH